MKNIILIISLCFFLFSCSSNNQSKNFNIKRAELAYSKLSNIKNNLTYEDYKMLVIEYGENNKFPELK
tara:strand:+ start:1110 stop:1313 length:204 start_codon:yes stop_codon:yes gene_type:complete